MSFICPKPGTFLPFIHLSFHLQGLFTQRGTLNFKENRAIFCDVDVSSAVPHFFFSAPRHFAMHLLTLIF